MTDHRDLCRRLARDLDGTFPDVVRTMQDQIYSGLRRLHPGDAEDLTQEAFIRAYRALQGYDASRIRDLRLAGWLWTIALNLGRNHARDRARRPIPVELDDRDAISDPEPPDTGAWAKRFDKLTGHQRRAVVLRHVAGLSIEEIARIVERPEGTVKADIHRGLARLRTIMEAER